MTILAGVAEEIPVPEDSVDAFEKAVFAHAQRRTVDSLVETLGTHSHTVVIPADQRAALLGRIRDYLRARPETATGEFDYPLHTEVIRAVPR